MTTLPFSHLTPQQTKESTARGQRETHLTEMPLVGGLGGGIASRKPIAVIKDIWLPNHAQLCAFSSTAQPGIFLCEPNLGVPPGPPPRWLRHCMCVACVAFGWKHARALEKVHTARRLQFSENDWTDRDSPFSHAGCSTNMADRMSRRASGQYRRLAHALVFQPFFTASPKFLLSRR